MLKKSATKHLKQMVSSKSVATEAKKEVAVQKKVREIKQKSKIKIPNSVFPYFKVLKMHYTYNGGLDTGASPTAGIIYQRKDAYATPQIVDLFNLNSISYPRNASLLFNQSDLRPQGYNELVGKYGKYKVFGAYVNIEFSNPNVDGTYIFIKKSSSDDTQRLDALSFNVAEMKKNVFPRITVNDTGKQVVKRKYYFSARELDGLSKDQFKNDLNNYTANIGNNPSSIPKLEIGIGSDTNTQRTCNYQIDIEYIVKVFRRESIPASAI